MQRMNPRKRKIVFLLVLLLTAFGGWLWWQRPRTVEMAGYVPADSVIYLECNNLPALIEGMTTTNAWRTLAGPAGLDVNAGRIGWLGRVATWTGLGPAEKVLFARSQIVVAVLGVQTAATNGALTLKPRYAVVIETHSSTRRARNVAETRLDEFARRAYGTPRREERPENDATWLTWYAPDGARQIVAAFTGSVVIVGPDADAVRACLEVRRGTRPSLEGSTVLTEMRGRVAAQDALAFGFIAPEGIAQVLRLGIAAYAAPLVLNDSRVAGLVDSLAPTLANKLSGGLAWSARREAGGNGGNIEDTYFLLLRNGLAAQLQEPLAIAQNAPDELAAFAPIGANSFSQYNYRNPSAAWAGLNRGLSANTDAVSAALVTRLMAAVWQPYGIDEPTAFLNALGSSAATVRLDDADGGAVTIIKANDINALRSFLPKLLDGTLQRTESYGAEIFRTAQTDGRAAAIAENYFLFGPADRVERCLQARQSGQNLAQQDAFRNAVNNLPSAQAATLTDDKTAARNFLKAVATRNAKGSTQDETLETALRGLPYAASTTRLTNDGFEKRTRSAWGLLGVMVGQFAAEKPPQTGN